jgi:hypothetical protein
MTNRIHCYYIIVMKSEHKMSKTYSGEGISIGDDVRFTNDC